MNVANSVPPEGLGNNDARVLTMGVFDILHQGHAECIDFCREIGGTVIVGLWPDSMVKRLKGDNRPVNSEMKRREEMWVNLLFDGESCFIADDYPTREEGIEKIAQSLSATHVVISSDRMLEAGSIVGGALVIVDPSYEGKKISTTRILQELSQTRTENE